MLQKGVRFWGVKTPSGVNAKLYNEVQFFYLTEIENATLKKTPKKIMHDLLYKKLWYFIKSALFCYC